MKEADIQKQIKDYLKLKGYVVFKHRNVGIIKPNGSYIPLPPDEKGICDIIGCSKDGRFVAIEVKVAGKNPSDEQINFIRQIIRNNGIAFVAHSLDDVLTRL